MNPPFKDKLGKGSSQPGTIAKLWPKKSSP